jgi:hypothetical protein
MSAPGAVHFDDDTDQALRGCLAPLVQGDDALRSLMKALGSSFIVGAAASAIQFAAVIADEMDLCVRHKAMADQLLAGDACATLPEGEREAARRQLERLSAQRTQDAEDLDEWRREFLGVTRPIARAKELCVAGIGRALSDAGVRLTADGSGAFAQVVSLLLAVDNPEHWTDWYLRAARAENLPRLVPR